MSMDNTARMQRVTQLISDISACQLDAQSHQQNFSNVNGMAYGALSDFLKSKNMTTVDQYVQSIIKDMPPATQQEILDHMKDLTPPTGLEFFLQPSELSKMMFGSFLRTASGVVKVTTPYYYQAKAWWINYRSHALLQATNTGQALNPEAQAIQKLTVAERQALLDTLQQERTALQEQLEGEGVEALDVSEDGALVDPAAITQQIANIEKSAAAIEGIDAAEVKAIQSAAKVTVWTKVFIVVNIVAIAGIMIYDKVKDDQEAKELQQTITQVCTARLYARMSERMEQTQTDQMGTIQMLMTALSQTPQSPDVISFIETNFITTINAGLGSITEQSTYTMLAAQDAAVNANTSEDPTLAQMQAARAQQENQPLGAGGSSS